MLIRGPSSLHQAVASSSRPSPLARPIASALARHKSRIVAARAVFDESSMTLADLRAQLDAALKVEDYKLAAQIRDTLQHKTVDARLAVEDANNAFYDAFRAGNVKAMEEIWGQGEHVQVIHPGSSCIAGREAVLDSWRAVLKNVRPRAFRVLIEDVRVFASDGHGFVTCVEVIDADDNKGRICATNIFEKQNGKWVITMHHGSVAPFSLRRP